MKKDISEKNDIKTLVDHFYSKVNKDPLLSPVFNMEAAVNWEEHLPKMYSFWSTQLLGTGTYKGKPFPPHAVLNINPQHFKRWLELFYQTVEENFEGPNALIAKQKATNIAAVFQYKLGYFDEKE